MPLKLSTPYYVGAFVVLFIVILVLLVISPTQNSFFELKELYPHIYYNLHENKPVYDKIIEEVLAATSINRIDMEPPPDDLKTNPNEVDIASNTRTNAKSPDVPSKNLVWLNYSPEKYSYIRGKVDILPLIYNGKQYENTAAFPTLMQFMQFQPNILNIYFWRLGAESALLQHPPKLVDGCANIHESSILDKKILRYTLAINVLSCVEEECSLWVGGQLKKLVFDTYVLWDPSKEFSLHNDSATEGDVLFLNIDIMRG